MLDSQTIIAWRWHKPQRNVIWCVSNLLIS